MKRLLSTLLLIIAPHVNAQFVAGQVLGAAQLNAALASPTITSGSINGAPIGQSNPKAVNATSVGVVGATSGTVSILPQSAAGTYNFNLPTTAGASGSVLTSGGGSSTPMTWTPQASLAVGSATVATQASTTLKSDNVAYYPMMGSAASTTNQGFNVSSGLSFNPTTGLNVAGSVTATAGRGFAAGNLFAYDSAGIGRMGSVAGSNLRLYSNGVNAVDFSSLGKPTFNAGAAVTGALGITGALDLATSAINTHGSGAYKWSYFSPSSNISFTGSTGFYVNDQANTKNIMTVLDAAPNNALVVGTTGTDIAGNVSVSSATSGTQQALKSSNLGYSPTYKALQIGAIDSTHAISLGVDVSGNPSAGFSGNEIVIPHTSNIVAPNAANTAFWPVFSVNGSTGVMNIGNVGITGGTIDGTVIGGTTAAAGSFTTLNASGLANFTANTTSLSINGAGLNSALAMLLKNTTAGQASPGLQFYNGDGYRHYLQESAGTAGLTLTAQDGTPFNIATKTVITDTTDSSSTTTGALRTAGGLGVAKKAYFGDTITVASKATISNATVGGAIGTSFQNELVNTHITAGDWIGTTYRWIAGNATTTQAYIGAVVTSSASNGLSDLVFGVKTAAGDAVVTEKMRLSSTSLTLDTGVNLVAAADVVLGKTITAAGTTGARTINKTTGRVNFAAAATSLVVTNSLATVDSICHVTKATNNATMRLGACVAGAGTLTIYADVAPDAETAVNFTVTN